MRVSPHLRLWNTQSPGTLPAQIVRVAILGTIGLWCAAVYTRDTGADPARGATVALALTVGAGAAATAVLLSPWYLLLAFVAVRPALDGIGQATGANQVLGLGFALTILLCLLLPAQGEAAGRRYPMDPAGLCVAIALPFCMLGAGMLGTTDSLASQAGRMATLALASALACRECCTPHRRLAVLVAVVVGCMPVVVMTLYGRAAGIGSVAAYTEGVERQGAVGIGSGLIAGFIAGDLVLLACVLAPLARHWATKVALGLLVCGSGYALVLSNTRSAVIAAAGGMVALGLATRRSWPIVVVALGLCAALGGSSDLRTRLMMVRAGDERSGSWNIRVESWPKLLQAAERSPLIGYGLGVTYNVPLLTKGAVLIRPHNDYIFMLLAGGVPGLIAFIASLALALRNGWLLARSGAIDTDRVVGAATVVLAVSLGTNSLVHNMFPAPVNYLRLFVLAGAAWTGLQVRADPVRQQRSPRRPGQSDGGALEAGDSVPSTHEGPPTHPRFPAPAPSAPRERR
jgi:O-antigen ligase